MKTLSVLLIGVLTCAHVLAGGTIGPKSKSVSASAVTRANGSKVIKVFYKSATIGKVDVSISNSAGEKLFGETIQNTNGFVRPYNLAELPEGEYTVTIKDEYGKTEEKIAYSNVAVEKFVNVKKIGDENKYLLTINSSQNDDFTILISDSDNNLIYEEAANIGGEFAKVYNLKNLKNFSIQVMDASGVLKKVKY
jgi:hypothetical protein